MADDDVTADSAVESDPGFQKLLEKLSETYNFELREYKPASLARRIRARMSQVHAETFDVYAGHLDAHSGEHVALFNTILVNVTTFFRDVEAWKTLADEVIPRIVSDAADTRSLRLWSAGCSSGEEVYSLAILLAEHLGERARDFEIKIYGTDVDEDALAAARHALYRTDQLKDVPDRYLDRYFTRDGQLWRLRRDLRRWCIFGAHNLAQAAPLSHLDLLLCRNVLIYFTSVLQERILSRFHYAIRDGGYVFLGRAESLLTRSRVFAPVNLKWRIFQRGGGAGAIGVVAPDRGSAAAASSRDELAPVGVRGQRALDALPLAVMVVDGSDTILLWNPVAETLFETPAANAVDRKFRDLDVSYRVEGLRARMEDVKARQVTARMDDVTFTRRAGEVVHATVTIAPLFDGSRSLGLLVCVEDATTYARLKEQMTRIAEQHATAIEELQSTNEELETTNEELQSTNEELETTNEELQSTNEELETTVEELQAANAELASLNGELEDRGAELARLDAYQRSIVDSVDHGLMVVDRLGVVRTWNHSAERMWGIRAGQVIGRDFSTLPLTGLIEHLRPAYDRMVASGHPQQVEGVRYTLPGGIQRRARMTLAPLKDALGATQGGIAWAWPEDAHAP
jgi:two-component system CheB/CheR fusion protein